VGDRILNYRNSVSFVCLIFLVLTTSVGSAQTIDINDMRVKTQTRAREMTIGRQASRRFERTAKLVKDAAVLAYVDGIAQTVARNSDSAVPITTKVVDSAEVNAFSYPGGFLYVNSGLIVAVDDEAEIAAVIAHEIAHVVARDGMRDSRYLGTTSNGNSPIVADSGGYLVPLRAVTSPRETAADSHAIQYLQKAGYDAAALVRFLQRMQATEPAQLESVLTMFQTHPPTAERIRLVQGQIDHIAPAGTLKVHGSDELQKIKTIILQPSNPRE
jgi:predicted Zn-dependent protease